MDNIRKTVIDLIRLNWKVSFQKEKTDEVLKENLKDIYDIIVDRNIFNESKSLFMIIVWNMITDDWSSNISFLASNEHLKKILYYLLLETLEIIPGTTTSIFKFNPNPKFILSFEKGNTFEFSRRPYKDITCYHFRLPEDFKNTYDKIRNKLLIIDNKLDWQNDKILKLVNYSKNDNYIDISNYLINNIKNEIVNKNYLSNLFNNNNDEIKEKLKSAITTILPKASEEEFEKFIMTFYKTVINIAGFLDNNQILKYYFNSSGATPVNKEQFGKYVQKDGGVFVVVENKEQNNIGDLCNNSDIDTFILSNVIFSKSSTAQRAFMKYMVDMGTLKTGVISILVDSYAHNISAHSLAALKWWFQQRSKILEKRIYAGENKIELSGLSPTEIKATQNIRKETTEKYYKTLNLTDSTFNSEYYSLFDYLQFTDKDKKLFQFSTEVPAKWDSKEGEYFNPRFPVPIDYAIYSFMRFLKDKGAFWSGVTRDMAFGGESKTLYQILWEDFANNPLYLGTIAYSEGISKLNIYLAFEKDNKIEKSGRFVTIDLSVIKYENDLANPYNENNTEQDINSAEKKGEKRKNESINCEGDESFVEYDKYSQYGFVRLGECFSYFRKGLSKDEYRVFLPGGVVGEHALFTILENTIRNIKHYKGKDFEKIKNNGIDLYISIQDDDERKYGDGEVARLKIGVWLNHETHLSAKVTDKVGKTIDKKIIEIMEEKARDSIVNELGVPRMGGNSQDKACAAMLFNNNFLSVESQDSELQKGYYPWIDFREEPPDGNKGIIKKYFTVWKSEDVYRFKGNDVKELRQKMEYENISRFKFFVSTEEINDEMRVILREKGVIRILDKVVADKKISYYYKKWLQNWAGIEINKDKPLVFLFSGRSENIMENTILGAIWTKDNTLVYNYQEDFPFGENDISHFMVLSHGEEKDINCNVRSHGQFMQKFFKVKDINELPKSKINVDENNKLLENEEDKEKNEIFLLEFIEAVRTKIMIFDDRVKDRFSVYNDEKMGMFKNQLFLEVYPEERSKFDELKKRFKKNERINMLIMHLSFIENLKDKDGKKYSEERIVDFIEKELISENDGALLENFIFVITSGRGRDDWNSIIRKNGTYARSTLFKPIETILNAVETGISYNDHFDIKYNLVKAIFGS